MYSTCLFCHASLGSNDAVEHFPIGRRLAFDAAKGRLWVVCGRCERWNLTPLEERWEAIEECERLYRDTRLRASTDNVGLARLRDGTELVRIGAPLRPEFAAWRYGDQFGRRRRRHLVHGAAMSAGGVAMWAAFTGAVAVGGAAMGAMLSVQISLNALESIRRKRREKQLDRVVARVVAPDGVDLDVRERDAMTLDFAPDGDDRWAFTMRSPIGTVRLVDGAATRVASVALARLNAAGGSSRQVRQAVEKLDWFAGPEGLRRFAARHGGLRKLGYEQRLALEMAVHEDAERRALEGELAELEAAWRDAEEIAAIADDMFLPSGVEDFIVRNRRRHIDG